LKKNLVNAQPISIIFEGLKRWIPRFARKGSPGKAITGENGVIKNQKVTHWVSNLL